MMDKIIVIKYGGNAMINEELKDAVMDDIVALREKGYMPVLSHGGGPGIKEMQEKMGLESRFVDGLRYTLYPGDIMLVSPGQMHRPDVPGRVRSVERFVLWLSVDYVKSIVRVLPHARYTLLGDLKGRNIIRGHGETDVVMRQLLLALHREADQDGADGAQMCGAIVSQMLIYCGRSMAGAVDRLPPKAELRYHEIMQVYEHIMFHLRDDLSVSGLEDLSVSRLAELFFMDKNTLTRQFKRQVGMTPGECIRWHRLEAARQLISSGTPTQTACVECGFSDYSAFYRAFRQAYGLNPRDYAARQREAVV